MSIALDRVDQEQLTLVFNSKPELKKLAYEFCSAFNTKICKVGGSGSSLYMVTPSGLPAGFITTMKVMGGETAYVYDNEMLIKKEKSSANVGRDARESNKISTLIRSLKKNNEYPNDISITKAYTATATCAVLPVKDQGRYGAPSMSVHKEMAKSLIEHFLGIDTLSVNHYADELKKMYSDYLVNMKTYNESTDDFTRFCNGFKLIGICYDNAYGSTAPDFYLLGDGTMDGNFKVNVQGTLKRYESLKDTEVAVDAMMIATYMQGKKESRIYSERNEMYIGRIEQYIPDLDICAGYSGKVTWVAIPKTPKQ